MRKPPGRHFLRAGAVFGALLVTASIIGPAPSARAVECRDNDGFWCLYGKPDLADGGGLIGTNNDDTDLKMDGDWSFFNDQTRSVSNRSGSYLGLYDDIDFKGLMACLPPGSSMNSIGAGVSSLRIHPTSAAACGRAGGAGRPKPKKSEPASSPTPKETATPSERPKKAAKPEASPTLPLPSLAPRLPAAPKVDASATKPAAGRSGDGVAWVAIAAIAVVVATLLALGVGGWLLGRRRTTPTPVPRTATDPGAARRVHDALLLLAIDCEQERRDVPKVRAVTIDHAEVTLHLAAPDGKAPRPWRAAPGGMRWRLPVIEIDELSADVDPASAPYPLLAAVRPGVWANLAALPGPIALTGNRKAARGAAVEMARRLREDPWHGSVRVRMVGFAPEAVIESEAGTERGRVVFIDDGLQVPDKPPPGSAVVSVGRPERAGTVWRVRHNGSIVMPADLLVKDAGPASAGSAADPADASASAAGGE
ncbi:peptidase inhibitor family I36 protein [Spirillospora sp. NBC_00431]